MKKKSIAIALAVGFAIAMVLMGISIYFGYTEAYRTNASALTVRMFGIPIYELTKRGEAYTGESMGPWMGFVCAICMALAVVVEEVVSAVSKAKRR